MTKDELRAFFDRHMEAWRQRDPTALAAHHASDGIVVSRMFGTVQSRAAIEESYRALFSAFPDWKLIVDTVLIDPPQIAVLANCDATHEREFFGLPGTHRRFEFQAALLLTIERDVITREERVYDFTGLLVQLGVLRAKPAKPEA